MFRSSIERSRWKAETFFEFNFCVSPNRTMKTFDTIFELRKIDANHEMCVPSSRWLSRQKFKALTSVLVDWKNFFISFGRNELLITVVEQKINEITEREGRVALEIDFTFSIWTRHNGIAVWRTVGIQLQFRACGSKYRDHYEQIFHSCFSISSAQPIKTL